MKEHSSKAFWYYWLCLLEVVGNFYQTVSNFIDRDGNKIENWKVWTFVVIIVVLTVFLTSKYFNSSENDKERLALPMAFVWTAVTIIITNAALNTFASDTQQAINAFTGFGIAILMFIAFDSLKAKKKPVGYMFIGSHVGIAVVMLTSALNNMGIEGIPDLSIIGDTAKFILFGVPGGAIVVGEIILINAWNDKKNANKIILELGEILLGWGILWLVAFLGAVFCSTAIPNSLHGFGFPALLFLSALFAVFQYGFNAEFDEDKD